MYLVFITVFLIGVVIGFYYVQDGQSLSLLVSPKVILETADSLENYELQEKELILLSLESANGDFGTLEFRDSFRSEFILGVDSLDLEFIYRDLTIESRALEVEARSSGREFIENTLYPKSLMYYSDDVLVVSRAEVGKEMVLKNSDSSKINFPIDFKWTFSREYLIKESGSGYVVEVIG